MVVTIRSLGGEDVAVFTRKLANRLGIGRKSYNDRVVILVAPNDRKARIGVGLGLESVLTNAVSAEIMDKRMLPRFKAGDFGGGIGAGVDAIIDRLK